MQDYLAQIPYTGGCGVCSFAALPMEEPARQKALALCPKAKAVGVVLFPYLVRDGEQPRELSLYACGRDYHQVLAEALEPVCQKLETAFPGYRFVALVDASPLPEVQAAWYAGAGILGGNGLVIDRNYGSYVFIGTILTDYPAKPTATSRETCPDCGACRRACPMGALDDGGGVQEGRCLSALTQTKDELTPEQQQAVRTHPLVWGCDICSEVCPLNRRAKETENPAFRENRLLQLEDVSGLTRKQFLARYPSRAFTWRGPKPIARNQRMKKGE